ncbi:MAG: CAP domain-containing protein [Thermomicrobiales bacterium]
MRACQDSPPGGNGAVIRVLFALVMLLAALGPLTLPAGADDIVASAESVGALAKINEARAAIGVPPLRTNAALDSAATAHANYYKLNFGAPSLAGMGLHYEDPTKPGFTGADFAARAKAAGYSGSINENIGLSGNLLVSLDWFLGTVNHRLTLLDPRYTDIGIAAINDGTIKIEVIDLGTIVWRKSIDPAWEPWPGPNATNVGTSFDGESNYIFTGANYPIGFPITLKYNGASAVVFSKAQLTANGAAVATFAQPGTGFITRNTYAIAATAPLQPGTAYTITVTGTLDSQPFTRSWSFTTKGTPPPATPTPAPAPTPAPTATPTATAAAQLPPGVAQADAAVIARWQGADYDIWRGAVARTWTWGPDVLAVKQERFDSAPGGTRTVYYFDKSRMEISDPQGDRANPWFITNGLLVREMVAGQLQVDDNAFVPLASPAVPLAGDGTGGNAVTYAALGPVASLKPGENSVPNRAGGTITETIDATGTVTKNPVLANAATYAYYDPALGHNIADVFWRWLAAQPVDWIYGTGHPLTEPYWTLARINGADVWVLVQAFERRVLTYVPGNSSGWQVEAGNVGRHYYQWRYGEALK